MVEIKKRKREFSAKGDEILECEVKTSRSRNVPSGITRDREAVGGVRGVERRNRTRLPNAGDC